MLKNRQLDVNREIGGLTIHKEMATLIKLSKEGLYYGKST